MTTSAKLIPTSSQTVGPYFRIGLDELGGSASKLREAGPESISIQGQVIDRDGTPVQDAMLEFWGVAEAVPGSLTDRVEADYPLGFGRAATDTNGRFSVLIRRPTPMGLGDGRMQAPHLIVLVFARGLLRHLITRLYFADEPANASDPLLLEVPVPRRDTLIATSHDDPPNSYHWNVILQGQEETVFFAW